jgi:RimJ/RimL family protein N-acetyltransferase
MRAIVKYADQYRPALLRVWEESVAATHDFLSPSDFHEISALVQAIDFNAFDVYCALEGGQVVGFLGVAGQKIEMLFIKPEFIGQGWGKQLLQHAIALLQADQVDVNEQNRHAVGFYQKFGFVAYERTAQDDQGRDYPLLRMRLAPASSAVPAPSHDGAGIETERLQLLPCGTELLRSAIQGDQQLAQHLGVAVAENWTEFGVGPLQYALEKLAGNTAERGWWTYFPIHKADHKLIGSGGYKGRPSAAGSVEVGYEIAPAYRNQGLATEMTRGLIEQAFKHPSVTAIIAHTLGQENPSTRVLAKCGFEHVETIHDPDDGLIWKWSLRRQ